MIDVKNLTKKYAGVVAVDDVSFTVEPGEVVGFLGPNGAGKTTTLRILAGYLPATRGDVRVAGHSVFTDSITVRRQIGYLPENCPLYAEMRTDEYLRYRAGLKGMDRRKRKVRIAEVKALCGLEDAGRRVLGQLSKGYRQRVGLADALIHDPPLLILDEPTVGLDPHQIRQVRELIRSLASRHTILLSTHILPEAEMMCDRILIINDGRIVAQDTPENLRKVLSPGRVELEAKGDRDRIERQILALPGVGITYQGASEDHWHTFILQSDRDVREEVCRAASQGGWVLRELHQHSRTLEDVFVTLTQGKEVSV